MSLRGSVVRGSDPLTLPQLALRAATQVVLLLLLLMAQGCGKGGGGSSGSSGAPVVGVSLAISTSALATGAVAVPYATGLTASGGSGGGYVWSVASGALPAGLALSGGGTLSGTPMTVGATNFTVKVTDSAGNTASSGLLLSVSDSTATSTYGLTGDVSPVYDPSIIRQGSKYYVFVTDAGVQASHIAIRCSTDRIAWIGCGYVFSAMPSWVGTAVPAATNIWAPDISYFGGSYHLYYAVTSFGSQNSAIGLATSPTLDATDPSYKWTDQGAVLTSATGANYNAIDPNVLVDVDGSVWLTYGSYWSGIFQQQLDPVTGKVLPGTTYHLAERAASVQFDPIEGSSLVHKGGYYYLFVSWDFCCNADQSTENYKIVVGRGTSAHGPFLDQQGVDMASGGGTILLQGDGVDWVGPGGQTVYLDATGGDLIVYHALNVKQNYLHYLFVRSLTWTDGWPVIGPA